MNRTIIAADSSCDLSPEQKERYGIRITPLHVIMGQRQCLDGVDVQANELYDYFDATGELPKTAANTPGEYEDFFRSLTADGSEAVHISLSAEFSSTYRNACLAAEEVPGVYVVDGRNLSTGSGLLALKAADMAAAGLPAGEIAEKLTALAQKVDASFVLDTLAYLRAGGRCSSVAAIGTSMLSLKPGIVVEDGKMHVGKKYMGNLAKCLQKYAADRLSGVEVDDTRVFVTHTRMDPALVETIKKQVADTGLFKEVLESTAGATVASHCGPNCLGVLFIRK